MTEERKVHRDVGAAVEGRDIVSQLMEAHSEHWNREDVAREAQLVSRLIELHVKHLVTMKEKPKPLDLIDKHRAAQLFVRNYARDAWNTTVYNYSLNDLLFLSVCYAHACAKPELMRKLQPQEENLQQMHVELRELGRGWHDTSTESLPSAADLFDRCAAVLVFVYGRPDGISLAVQQCDRKILSVDGSHPSLPRAEAVRVAAPAGDDSKADKKRDERVVRMEQEAEKSQHVSALTSTFLGLCARIFLHVWADDWILKSMPRDTSVFDAKQSELKTGKIHDWMVQEIRAGVSSEFQQLWAAMPYRQWLPLGAVRYHQRLPARRSAKSAAYQLFQDDTGEAFFKQYTALAKTKASKIAADPKHPLYSALLLTFYGFRFHIEFENYKFLDKLCVLGDEVCARASLIRSQLTPERKARPPIIVQLAGEFYLNHNQRWFPFGKHVEACLLQQLRWMGDTLPTGEELAKQWSVQFL